MAQEATCIAVPLSFITQSPVTAANRRISTLLSLPDALHAGFPWDRSQPATFPLWPFRPALFFPFNAIFSSGSLPLLQYIITGADRCQGPPQGLNVNLYRSSKEKERTERRSGVTVRTREADDASPWAAAAVERPERCMSPPQHNFICLSRKLFHSFPRLTG